jgi:integrin alpha FG-GAP repeat containing protein 1
MFSRRPGKRRRLAISSTVFWATNLFISPAFAIWPFPPKRFTGNALIDAGSMGLSGDGRVVALGDFDGNQLYMLFFFFALVVLLKDLKVGYPHVRF